MNWCHSTDNQYRLDYHLRKFKKYIHKIIRVLILEYSYNYLSIYTTDTHIIMFLSIISVSIP